MATKKTTKKIETEVPYPGEMHKPVGGSHHFINNGVTQGKGEVLDSGPGNSGAQFYEGGKPVQNLLPHAGQHNVIVATPSMQNQEASGLLAFIEKASANPKFDVVKLEKLIDLRERVLNRAAEESFARDLVDMKAELPIVLRTKNNTQTTSKYAPLEQINKIVDPILKKYGFADSGVVKEQTATHVTVEAKLWHKGGHKETTLLTMPLDATGFKGNANKSGPQAVASSVMYCRRVAKALLLNISTGEDDGNVDKAEKQPDAFNEAMHDQAGSSDQEKWDGKTIKVGSATVKGNWKTPLEAGTELLGQLATLAAKESRIATINANLGLVAALIGSNAGNLVGEMHKVADQGAE